MATAIGFVCPLPNGLHARPASLLADWAARFAVEIVLCNTRNGKSGNAKSVLELVATDLRHGDPMEFRISGPDEARACQALDAFLHEVFPHCDEALPAIPTAQPGCPRLPACLRDSALDVHAGTPVAGGLGLGTLVAADDPPLAQLAATLAAGTPDEEQSKLDLAWQALRHHYDQHLQAMPEGLESAILAAHRSVAADPALIDCISAALRQPGCSAAMAVAAAESKFRKLLLDSESAMLRERAMDVRDVCLSLLRHLPGFSGIPVAPVLTGDSIVTATELTPARFLALDRTFLKGLALGHAGATSHTVILARSFGIPTLIGMASLPCPGQEAVLDAELGILGTALDAAARRYYELEAARMARRAARAGLHAHAPALTADGFALEIGATIAAAAETAAAMADGADGIGLFRVEMLFLDRRDPPGEEEQFACYREVLRAADGRPAIIRMLDVGGDKPLSYLALPREDNPFLGSRGVRIYAAHEAMIRLQVRALVRASAFGKLKVLIPMVSRVEEMRWIRGIIREEQARCRSLGMDCDPGMQVGAMIEVPSAAFGIAPLCAHADFFSIGTNDLLQYFVAADRGNQAVAGVADDLHPAFWSLLRHTVDAAHAHGRWIGLCGEIAAKTDCLPLLVGLGLDEISLPGKRIAETKASITGLRRSTCLEHLEALLQTDSATDARAIAKAFAPQSDLPVISARLMDLGCDARDKAEAIKAACDLLYIDNRANAPRDIEEAIWQRESTYSTGFGYGIAIPHCKTDAVAANSLVVLRLLEPVEWGASDGAPVRLILLLAIRSGDHAKEHLKLLARLARKVMHDEFRSHLLRESNPAALRDFLRDQLA